MMQSMRGGRKIRVCGTIELNTGVVAVVAVGLLYLASFIVVPFLEDSAASQPADSHLGAIHIDAGNVYQPGDVARPPPPVNQKDLDEIKQLRLENDALKAASMDTLRLENEALKTALRHQVMDAEAKRVVDPRAGRQADRTIDPARTVDRKQHKLKAQKKAELDSSARVKKASEPSVKWPPPPPPQFRNSQKWRTDGRCGPKYITEASPDFGECDPDADADQKGPCCNPTSGWCGNVRDAAWGHCPPACLDCVDFSPAGKLKGLNKPKAGAPPPPPPKDPPAYKIPDSPKNVPAPPGATMTQKIGQNRPEAEEDAEVVRRRNVVRGMMKSAWDGYAAHAWGANELMPKAKKGHSAGIFGVSKMGATIVDAIDTLLIMGFTDEAAKARDWVAEHLSFDVSASVSVFEVTIRFVGGLISAYAMTGDDIYRQKAQDLATRLLPAFKTPTGIPMAQINLKSGGSRNWGWAAGKCSILSEFGTMQLEFEYLSLISGDQRFSDTIAHVTDYVVKKQPKNGLYPNYLHPKTGNWGTAHTSVGALGDSFYEYLLKMWVFHGGRNHPGVEVDAHGRKPFDNAMGPINKQLVFKTKSGLTYVAESKGGRPQHKMGHLACFMGGLYALGSKDAGDVSKEYMDLAKGVTNTCHEGYKRSASGIGPESMEFNSKVEATAARAGERYYILRPETVESYFYLWRLTKDQKYRDWAWEAIQAIEKHCRCGENGYCGLKDVSSAHPVQDDVQQSFFLAETLKYLYLIWCDDEVMDLTKWVFNTEAHAVPIQNDVTYTPKK